MYLAARDQLSGHGQEIWSPGTLAAYQRASLGARKPGSPEAPEADIRRDTSFRARRNGEAGILEQSPGLGALAEGLPTNGAANEQIRLGSKQPGR